MKKSAKEDPDKTLFNTEQIKVNKPDPFARIKMLFGNRPRHEQQVSFSDLLDSDKRPFLQSLLSLRFDGYKLKRRNESDPVSFDVMTVENNTTRVVMAGMAAHAHESMDAMRLKTMQQNVSLIGLADGISAMGHEVATDSGRLASSWLKYLMDRMLPTQSLSKFVESDVRNLDHSFLTEVDKLGLTNGDTTCQVIKDVKEKNGTHSVEFLLFGGAGNLGQIVVISPDGIVQKLETENHVPRFVRYVYEKISQMTPKERNKTPILSHTVNNILPGSYIFMTSDGFHPYLKGDETETFWAKLQALVANRTKVNEVAFAALLKEYAQADKGKDDISAMLIRLK